MATGVSLSSVTLTNSFERKTPFSGKPISETSPFLLLASSSIHFNRKRWKSMRSVMEKKAENDHAKVKDDMTVTKALEDTEKLNIITLRASERLERKRSERYTYLVAAIMSSLGVTSAAAMAVYYRFYWQTEVGEYLLPEMFGTFALSVGSAVGMEFWARWAHRALWHASLWQMHEGLGITTFGMAYMFVHDGLVHRRFLVGPIADVPYLRKVAAAHQLHHSCIFNGVPYGLFLGPKEIKEVGGMEELEKEVQRMARKSNS
ncbi:beta-carotene hydroxylase 2, chloroplastic-like isoform X2 [Pyrus communis]|uniref:beta-carotene hydroxylase 2, chloroplastic-like isoform X2 n=1 Tax=Pyrus communis TaxID=23211 RepID=UPI0035BF375E